VRTFAIGEICVHKGFICRVDAAERSIYGVTRPSGYGIKDGTEVNPTLTLTTLYGPDGEPVKNAKSRRAISGAVEYVHDVLNAMEKQIALYEKRRAILQPTRAQVDPDVRALFFECGTCPSGCTCFEVRVTTEEQEQLKALTTSLHLTCPRGHPVTWANVRGTAAVDDAGYTIDRNHPLSQRISPCATSSSPSTPSPTPKRARRATSPS
jgi:hypothetical protein